MKIRLWKVLNIGNTPLFVITRVSNDRDAKLQALVKVIYKVHGLKKPRETKYRESKEWNEWFSYFRHASLVEIKFLDARKETITS